MTRKTPKKQGIVSSHAKEKRKLQKAKLEQSIQGIPQREAASDTTSIGNIAGDEVVVFEYTFNWGGAENEGTLVPNTLKEGDLPEITTPALRDLINHIARGKKTPPELDAELNKQSGRDIFDAVSEGVSRWHISGLSRERK